MLIPLPIDPLLPRVVEQLRQHPALVITAPPGTGKTTRVPRALFEAGFAEAGQILILEPRRLATRLAAARVAEELGEKTGKTVGYSMRFETVEGPETRLRFITEGVLSRRIIQDPTLAGISVVVLDEFHERHLTTDVALAFLRRLQQQKRALKLIVMSATLDADVVASFLQAPVVRGEGSRFEVEIEFEERRDDRPLHERIASAATRLERAGVDGHVLVFLPGSYEIRRAAEALDVVARRAGLAVVPLHGDLTAAEQARAVRESPQRKIILATNVAETSITIPGVAAVIDSGLARVAGHSAWNGLPTLTIEKVSKASADQRAGRAGRTRAGRVVRLYSRSDYEARPERALPEIRRADLAETLLSLHGAGVAEPGDLPWFEPPAETALAAAAQLLVRLGALDENKCLTDIGRRMLRLPLHPRLARLIVEGERLGVVGDACIAAALLSERDIRLDARGGPGNAHPRRSSRAAALSDLIELLDLFREAERSGFEGEILRRLGLDPRALGSADRARHQLGRLLHGRGCVKASPGPQQNSEEALLIATLTAFPDRVAKRRAAGSRELLLAVGGSARLSDTSVVHHAPLMVAVDAEERKGRKGSPDTQGVLVRLASAVEPEWLAAFLPDELGTSLELVWNDQEGRVEEIRKTRFGEIVLEESRRAAPPSTEASRLLANAVLAKGAHLFGDDEGGSSLQARLTLLAEYFPEEELTAVSDAGLREAVEQLCSGKRSFAELAGSSLTDILTRNLAPRQRSLLNRETPERVDLARRRNVRVHYEAGRAPWIESRLQDFLGMTSVPSICAGRLPLTVHLLAPNGQAVQVTRDLAGFWQRHYPSIRRELQRRYPKHAWPDPEELAR